MAPVVPISSVTHPQESTPSEPPVVVQAEEPRYVIIDGQKYIMKTTSYVSSTNTTYSCLQGNVR